MKFLSLSFALIVFAVSATAAERSIVLAAHIDMVAGIKTALDHFAADCGRYPTTSEGFAGLVNCPTNFSGGKWHGPYLDAIPIDPWGNAFVYSCPGTHNTKGFDIYSCGFDGISKSGGEDLDDINNWDPDSPHGGHDGYLNHFELITNSPIFFLSILILWITITMSGLFRLIGAIFSQRIRDSIVRRPILHIIWLLMSLIFFIIFILSFPKLAG